MNVVADTKATLHSNLSCSSSGVTENALSYLHGPADLIERPPELGIGVDPEDLPQVDAYYHLVPHVPTSPGQLTLSCRLSASAMMMGLKA